MAVYLLFLAVLTSIATVSALDGANCTVPQYDWTFNSGGGSLCRVAEHLFLSCNISLTICPLDSHSFYTGMTPDFSYPCWCNSVFYSLLSGCAICQGALLNHWSDFSKGCPKSWMTTYPLTIPAGLRVPHWAYLNVQTNDIFDPAAAASAVGSESTAPSPGRPARSSIVTSSSDSTLSASTVTVLSTSSTISDTITSVFSTSITSSISSTASVSSASPSVDPSPSGVPRRTTIAAGVAGGIVTLGLVAGLFFCYRRRKIKASQKLLVCPYNITMQSETRKKPHDPQNGARYVELRGLNQSTIAQSSRKFRVHGLPYAATSGVVNIGQSPGRF